jgi:hypothetical protein
MSNQVHKQNQQERLPQDLDGSMTQMKLTKQKEFG